MLVIFEQDYLRELYEHLHGNKEGLSSVRVNDQYRIEFREIIKDEKAIAEIVSITELSNHYK